MKNTVFLIILLIGMALLWSHWPCLRLNFIGSPTALAGLDTTDQSFEVVFLFGDACTACPSGEALDQLRNRAHYWFFEEGTRDGEIQNFMETFEVMGQPLVDDGSIARFLEKLSHCRDDESWHKNYVYTVRSGNLERDSLRIFN